MGVAGRRAVPARLLHGLQLAVSGDGTNAAPTFSTGFLRDGQPVVHPVFQKRIGRRQRPLRAAGGQRPGGRHGLVAVVP